MQAEAKDDQPWFLSIIPILLTAGRTRELE